MTIDLSQIITNLQSDVDAADSDTSMRDILSLLHRGKKVTELHKWYDSSGVLPIDSAYNGYMAFTKSDNTMRVFNDSDLRWAELDSSYTAAPSAPVYAGENYGYSMGGGSSPYTQNIDNYSFASDGNATNVGAMDNPDGTAVWSGSGGGSTTHGYHLGGSPVSPFSSPIFKFPYTSGTPISDTGNDIVASQMHRYGHYEMCGDRTNIYIVGGYRGPAYPTLANKNTILSFAATSDGSTITDYGDLTAAKRFAQTGTSETHGYSAGGYTSAAINTIDKWPFAASANATDVGDLTAPSYAATGASSSTHGYIAGALTPSATNVIEKYSFSVDGNSSDVADLFEQKSQAAGASSTTHGYLAGGNPATVTIQKYSFTADENGTDVGDLAFARRANAGTHY